MSQQSPPSPAPQAPARLERRVFIVTGQVQGVGFRPFVYRLALECGLTGQVGNSPEGVRIEVQGYGHSLDRFELEFPLRLPPLARVTSLRRGDLLMVAGENAFSIAASNEGSHQGHQVLVSPDMAVCDACLADMSDPANRRYGYAFTNCTDCGPRYSITRSIPYDRPVTSMACFPLCPNCAKEYADPLDRRFHAQPNACPVCGPSLWLEEARQGAEQGQGLASAKVRDAEAVLGCLQALRQGRIAAIKGLGGFHLACNALDNQAIARLRQRKQRPHKSLAVMVRDLATAERFAHIGPRAREALLSPERPIVICPRRSGPGTLPPALAPDSADIGLMLPYTPLHHVLFRPELTGGEPEHALPALVMTSGNAGGEPICLGNREARRELEGIADLFLFHNRDILVRVDDSVLMPGGEPDDPAAVPGGLPHRPPAPPIMLRRARGFVPSVLLLPELPGSDEDDQVDKGDKGNQANQGAQVVPVAQGDQDDQGKANETGETAGIGEPGGLNKAARAEHSGLTDSAVSAGPVGFPRKGLPRSVLAVGAELKHSFCLTRGREAFVSQHIGQLSQAGPLRFFRESLAHLTRLLEVEPNVIIRDLHPDYLSSREAEALGREWGIPVLTLQHHMAHIHAVLAEHGRLGPTLGLALDGSGLGERLGIGDYGDHGESLPEGDHPGEKGEYSVADPCGANTLWGGELLFVHPEALGQPGAGGACGGRRLGCLSPFPLPGGEAAIRAPWRIAEALVRRLRPAFRRPWATDPARAAMLPLLGEMLDRGVQCPLTSSCGRLFDAVSALCGLCFAISYEGQAAILLEEAQDWSEPGAYALPLLRRGGLWHLDCYALVDQVLDDLQAGLGPGRCARRFQRGLALGLAQWAATAAEEHGLRHVALAGGVLNNRSLAAELPPLLEERGLIPLLARAFPPGDGAIALGQAAYGVRLVPPPGQ